MIPTEKYQAAVAALYAAGVGSIVEQDWPANAKYDLSEPYRMALLTVRVPVAEVGPMAARLAVLAAEHRLSLRVWTDGEGGHADLQIQASMTLPAARAA